MPATIKNVASRLIRSVARPFKAVAKPAMRYVIRRLSVRFADEIVPLADLARKTEELGRRQDRQEGFHWDHAALAKRLAVMEDQLEKLLQHAGAEEQAPAEEPENIRPVIRLAPDEPERSGPLAYERQYRWEKTG